jgi:hypothetical protein
MLMIPLASGNKFHAPIGLQPRAVVDVMGNHEAHIEAMPTLRYVEYTVHVVLPGGPVPAGVALYLGHVVSSYGAQVIHYYAVMHDAD